MSFPIPETNRRLPQRHALFGILFVTSVLLVWTPIRELFGFALAKDHGTHVIFIAPLALYLLYLERTEISREVSSSPLIGITSFLFSSACAVMVVHGCVGANCLSLEIATLVTVWISIFILSYGLPAFLQARFALLLLFLMVPFPDFMIDKAIFWLQGGSAAVSNWILHIFGVPVMREGFILHLPALDLEVEKECSGIRSSLVLFVTTLLVGKFALRSVWARCLLLLAIVPIVIFKNGARIVSIALLTIYVNRAFLHGWLHRSGGIVFYLLGLLALYPVLMTLRSLEDRPPLGAKSRTPARPIQA